MPHWKKDQYEQVDELKNPAWDKNQSTDFKKGLVEIDFIYSILGIKACWILDNIKYHKWIICKSSRSA